MVGVFGRSLSFPNKTNPNRPSQKPPISHHIRSISLPCRSHPLISQIKEEINGLTAWSSVSKLHQLTSADICNGLNRLKEMHDTLEHILHLPQTQDSLRRHQPTWVEKLLEDFLRFVDVYGIFQSSILALKEHHSCAQMGLRKKDESKVVLYVKAKKTMAKEMEKLVSDMRLCVSVSNNTTSLGDAVLVSIGDAELAGVIEDVIRVTLLVSVALFDGIGSSFSSSSRKLTWTQLVKMSTRGKSKKKKEEEGIKELVEDDGVENLISNYLKKKKKGDNDDDHNCEVEVRSVLKRMRDLEESICGIESASERVFRALINSRVALLNTRTQ